MIGVYKRILIAISTMGILLFAWTLCLGNAWTIQHYENQVELRYKAKELTMDSLVQMEEREEQSEEKIVQTFTAWNEEADKHFENKNLNKKISGNVIEVYGDMSLLIGKKKLWGMPLNEGSRNEVVISSGLAQELWGGIDVIGKEVEIDEAIYTVKGIVEEKQTMAFVYATEEKDIAFGALRIEMVDISNIQEDVATLNMKYNLPEGTLKNLSLTTLFLMQLALLPGWVLGIYSLLKIYSFIYKNHQYWVSALVLGAIALLATVGIIAILQIDIEIPAYMLPNQWSDFEWWGRMSDNLINTGEAMDRLPTYMLDKWYEMIKSQIIVSGLITVFSMTVMVKKIKVSSAKTLFWTVLLTLVSTFFSIIILYGMGVEVFITRALWLVIPSYFVIQLIIAKWQEILEN